MCRTAVSGFSGPPQVWNTVAGGAGNLLRISMYGLGASRQPKHHIRVRFPTGSAYVIAVGRDGARVKVYERPV